MPKPKAPVKVQAVLTGPCADTLFDQPDPDQRHVELALVITQNESDGSESQIRFYLQGTNFRSRESGKWFPPCIHPVQFDNYGFHISLNWGEHAVKHLRAVYRYIDRLPVRPQTIGDLVRAIGTLYHVQEIELYARDQHNDRPQAHPDIVNLGRLANEIQHRYDRLVPEGEAHITE